MSRFTDALVVSPLADGRTWVVQRPFGYDVGVEGSGDSVDVQIGFMTDFASVPRPLWMMVPRWGKYGNAAVVHDWLYWTQERPRREADEIMLEAMGVLLVSPWQKYPIYWAVRSLGWLAWRRNRWDRDAGFDRVSREIELKAAVPSARPGLIRRVWEHYVHPSTGA